MKKIFTTFIALFMSATATTTNTLIDTAEHYKQTINIEQETPVNGDLSMNRDYELESGMLSIIGRDVISVYENLTSRGYEVYVTSIFSDSDIYVITDAFCLDGTVYITYSLGYYGQYENIEYPWFD